LTECVNRLTNFVTFVGSNVLITKGFRFGEAIALSKASADFPLPNPQRELLKTSFRGSLLLLPELLVFEPRGDAQGSPALPVPVFCVLPSSSWAERW
jgi:hypothetical protein